MFPTQFPPSFPNSGPFPGSMIIPSIPSHIPVAKEGSKVDEFFNNCTCFTQDQLTFLKAAFKALVPTGVATAANIPFNGGIPTTSSMTSSAKKAPLSASDGGCCYIMKRGERKDNPCGKKVKAGTSYCSSHQPKGETEDPNIPMQKVPSTMNFGNINSLPVANLGQNKTSRFVVDEYDPSRSLFVESIRKFILHTPNSDEPSASKVLGKLKCDESGNVMKDSEGKDIIIKLSEHDHIYAQQSGLEVQDDGALADESSASGPVPMSVPIMNTFTSTLPQMSQIPQIPSGPSQTFQLPTMPITMPVPPSGPLSGTMTMPKLNVPPMPRIPTTMPNLSIPSFGATMPNLSLPQLGVVNSSSSE